MNFVESRATKSTKNDKQFCFFPSCKVWQILWSYLTFHKRSKRWILSMSVCSNFEREMTTDDVIIDKYPKSFASFHTHTPVMCENETFHFVCFFIEFNYFRELQTSRFIHWAKKKYFPFFVGLSDEFNVLGPCIESRTNGFESKCVFFCHSIASDTNYCYSKNMPRKVARARIP